METNRQIRQLQQLYLIGLNDVRQKNRLKDLKKFEVFTVKNKFYFNF